MLVRMRSAIVAAAVGSVVLAGAASSSAALAGQPKLDAETCTQLHGEQATFIQSGILADLQRGPAWGKSNLSADRLREIEHYIVLDEQIKFACRQATLTPEIARAGEIAKRLEANPNLDPFVPLPEPNAKPEADAGNSSPTIQPGTAPEVQPVLKPKAERRSAPVDEATHVPAKAAADAKPSVKPKPAAKADDALKVAPTHVAPPPTAAPPPKGGSGLAP